MYYYCIVASICDEVRRTNSYLVCDGFNSVEEAMDYINEHKISEADYYQYCNDNETAYIEIERHDASGAVFDVITVD